MRLFLLPFLALFAAAARGQNPAITNRTYYDHYVGPTSVKGGMVGPVDRLKSRNLGTNWLRREEVIPVLLEELKKAGYDQVYADRLYRLDSAQYVVLAACSFNSNVGFLYAEGHAAFPTAAARQPRSRSFLAGKYDYVQFAGTVAGQQELIKVRQLPANVLLLAEDWYWYQYTENPRDDQYLVTKADIVQVLRQDIADKLAAAPKPKRR